LLFKFHTLTCIINTIQYISGLLSEPQKDIDKSFYERWLSQMDKKLDEEFRSENFLEIMSNFLLSLSRIIKDSKYFGLKK
jgi:hypothetical protein